MHHVSCITCCCIGFCFHLVLLISELFLGHLGSHLTLQMPLSLAPGFPSKSSFSAPAKRARSLCLQHRLYLLGLAVVVNLLPSSEQQCQCMLYAMLVLYLLGTLSFCWGNATFLLSSPHGMQVLCCSQEAIRLAVCLPHLWVWAATVLLLVVFQPVQGRHQGQQLQVSCLCQMPTSLAHDQNGRISLVYSTSF